jgi:hypothetical protein
MTQQSTLNRILVMLCLFAIPCAQLFGVNRVFLCDCSGVPVAMLEDRCFGADGEDCHPDGHGHEDGDHHDNPDGHPSNHAEFRTSAFTLKPIALPAPAVLDALHIVLPLSCAATPCESRLLLPTFCDPPPNTTQARHFVLLI